MYFINTVCPTQIPRDIYIPIFPLSTSKDKIPIFIFSNILVDPVTYFHNSKLLSYTKTKKQTLPFPIPIMSTQHNTILAPYSSIRKKIHRPHRTRKCPLHHLPLNSRCPRPRTSLRFRPLHVLVPETGRQIRRRGRCFGCYDWGGETAGCWEGRGCAFCGGGLCGAEG